MTDFANRMRARRGEKPHQLSPTLTHMPTFKEIVTFFERYGWEVGYQQMRVIRKAFSMGLPQPNLVEYAGDYEEATLCVYWKKESTCNGFAFRDGDVVLTASKNYIRERLLPLEVDAPWFQALKEWWNDE